MLALYGDKYPLDWDSQGLENGVEFIPKSVTLIIYQT